MAIRVAPPEIVEMHRLYDELGSAAEVARRMKRSVTTVRRYLQMEDCPEDLQYTAEELVGSMDRG